MLSKFKIFVFIMLFLGSFAAFNVNFNSHKVFAATRSDQQVDPNDNNNQGLKQQLQDQLNCNNRLTECIQADDPEALNVIIGAITLVLLVIIFVVLPLTVLMYASIFLIFKKAGKNPWYALIPGYNLWLLYEISGEPGWWTIFGFVYIALLTDEVFINSLIGNMVLIVAIVLSAKMSISLAKRFGRDNVFGAVLLFLLPIIGYPKLAFEKQNIIKLKY